MAGEPERLPRKRSPYLEDSENTLLFSPAGLWEVAIKRALGGEDFVADPHILRRGLLDNAYEELPVRGEHAVAVGDLPAILKDPFDRMLVVRSQVEAVILLTSNPLVARYPGPIRKV